MSCTLQSENTTDSRDSSLRPQQLTWVALLGRWVDFAKSALALPDTTAGIALRESVPDIIMLQAVTSALTDLQALPPEERALGYDRAEVLIDRHAESLGRRWCAEPMRPDGPADPLPPQLQELIDQARAQLGAVTDQQRSPNEQRRV